MTPIAEDDFIGSPTVPPVAEQQMREIGRIYMDALENLKAATIQTWKLMWEPDGIAERIGIMGATAKESLAKHRRTWEYLEAMGVSVPDEFKAPPAGLSLPE